MHFILEIDYIIFNFTILILGYTGNDWTAMDPAILSFRQFSFPHQTQITPQMQPQQQELFLQQLAQQQTGKVKPRNWNI